VGVNKIYKGYKSFSYLDSGDYKVFKLAKELNRVEPYVVPLSAEEEKRVNRIVRENVVISLHDHPIVFPQDMGEVFDYIRGGRIFTAFEGLSKSCLDCVFDNLMDGMSQITSHSGWKWDDVIYDIGIRLSDIAHQDFVVVAKNVNDILQAHEEGKVAFVLSIEGAMPIENEIDRIDILYGFGVRMMGLSYSESSALATGLREKRDGGLTDFGARCVERMNKLGMGIDVSHCSDQTALDVVEVSKKPIFATHVGARALWNTKRMKPDKVLKAIAAKGGLIGIEAAPHTTITREHNAHSIDSVMEHFEYIKNLVGIDHVTFGLDTLFGDHVALHHALSTAFSLNQITSSTDFTPVPYVKGLENPTEGYWNVVRWLVKNGYSDEDIVKVIGGNTIRVLREVWY